MDHHKLMKNIRRCIEILASLKKSWANFEAMGYLLESSSNQFLVKDLI